MPVRLGPDQKQIVTADTRIVFGLSCDWIADEAPGTRSPGDGLDASREFTEYERVVCPGLARPSKGGSWQATCSLGEQPTEGGWVPTEIGRPWRSRER